MEYYNLESLTHHQPITPRTLRTVTQFLLSISVFTFIYCSHRSSWCCFMLNSLKYYISAISFHGLDKSWIFLICNGILMAVATTSAGLVSSPSKGFDMAENHVIADGPRAPEESKEDVEWLAEPIPNAVVQVEEMENDHEETLKVEDQGSQDDPRFEEERGGDHLILIDEDHEEQELERGAPLKQPEESTEAEAEEIRTYYTLEETHRQENEENLEAGGIHLGEEVQVEDEEEEKRGLEKLSTEELNKKFDDFIRKMKEELRIEAQQQLVVVK
ncbi:uncharacterized protein [Coffea arabica]|uniref:Uncharacterized protein n=1 Tax=Coffea arabica TaxID=13443 RepID=A0A6P6S922_COFAR|nr:uncharacterized protein LOC113688770 [Coffea arabica]